MSLTVESYDRIEDAARAMGEGAEFIAGGTLVMKAANYAAPGLRRIIRLKGGAPARIETQGERLIIGAGLSMAAVTRARELSFLHPVAKAVGGPAVRNMATVGGNLFARQPYGDFAAALLALDGRARLSDGREAPLDELFSRGTGGALVSSVSIARPREGEFRFRKVTRVKPVGASVLSLAAWLPGGGWRIAGARIAFCGMAPKPRRALAAERALEGRSLDEAGVSAAVAAAAEGLEPADDALASAWYRREVAGVHLRRLLLERERR